MAMSVERSHVVIAGGGPAALETLMAVRDLAEDRVRITLVAPEAELEIKALRTAAPFSVDHVRRYPLADMTRRWGAELVADDLATVRPHDRVAVLHSGEQMRYDDLVVAVGARARDAFPGVAHTFGTETGDEWLNGVLADMEGGYSKSLALIVPPGVSWPLPAYELALMTAREVWAMNIKDAEIEIVTPEDSPLAIFGPAASHGVRELLEKANVTFCGATYASVDAGRQITLHPGGRMLRAERLISLAVLEGPRINGLPADPDGFLIIDDHARVLNTDHVYAVGDAANFPIKQGGLACQQADAAAQMIAHTVGSPTAPEPFRPVLRGKLLTGHGAHYLRSALHGGGGEGEVSALELWWPPTKVSGRYLSRWLSVYDAAAQETAQPGRHGDHIPEAGAPTSTAQRPAAASANQIATRPSEPEDVDVEIHLPSPRELRDRALGLDPYSFPSRFQR